MNHKILATALLLSIALPSIAFAQTATGTGVSESTSSSGSASVAGALNEGNTTTLTFEGGTVQDRAQTPPVALVTPPGSSNSCADTIGAGGSRPTFGVVVNIPVPSDRCNAREDARIMLSNAQAAEATMGRGAGAVDVLAARNRLSQISDNQEAYAQARAELALRQSASASASTASSTSSEATVEDDELHGSLPVLVTLRDDGPAGPTQ